MNPSTAYDKIITALCIWREARSESMAVRNGVFHVVLNRCSDLKGRWPKTPHGVCLQKFQFSSFNLGSVGSVTWPEEHAPADWQAFQEIQQLIESPLLADPTQGANCYHDASIEPPFRAWLGADASLEDLLKLKTCQIGSLSFYAL